MKFTSLDFQQQTLVTFVRFVVQTSRTCVRECNEPNRQKCLPCKYAATTHKIKLNYTQNSEVRNMRGRRDVAQHL